MKLLVDSSFLLRAAESGKNFLELTEDLIGQDIEPIILDTTLEELERLAKSRGRRSSLAKLCLKFAKNMNVRKSAGDDVDDQIINFAKNIRCAVATNDMALKKRLRSLGTTTILIASNDKIRVEGRSHLL